MTTVLRATTAVELEAIDCAIHDQLFDVDAIEFEAATTRIPLFIEDVQREEVLDTTRAGRPKKALIPLRRASLVFERVAECDVRDHSQIGTVSAVDLRFDAEAGEVALEAAEGVEVVLNVDALDVTLTITDQIVGRVHARYFWFGGEARSRAEIFSR